MTFSISFFKPGKYRFLWLIFSSWNFIFVIHLFFSLSLSLSLSLIYKSLGLNLFWLYVLFFFCCSVLFSNHYLFLCWSVCFTFYRHDWGVIYTCQKIATLKNAFCNCWDEKDKLHLDEQNFSSHLWTFYKMTKAFYDKFNEI